MAGRMRQYNLDLELECWTSTVIVQRLKFIEFSVRVILKRCVSQRNVPMFLKDGIRRLVHPSVLNA